MAVNHPPEAQDFVLAANAGEMISFTIQDFLGHVSEPDLMLGTTDAVEKIQITALPDSAQGQLYLNGSTVSALEEILLADIDKLTFVPTDASTAQAQFAWKAWDGTAWSNRPALTTLAFASDAVGYARMHMVADSNSGSEGTGVVVGSSGGIFMVGDYHGTVNMGSNTLTNVNGGGFVEKLNSSGVPQWAMEIDHADGTIQMHGVRVVSEGSNNYLYVTGQFSGGLNPNAPDPSHSFDSTGLDFFVEKIDITGSNPVLVWAHVLGGAGDQDGQIVRADSTGITLGWGDVQGTGSSGGAAHLTKFNADGSTALDLPVNTDGSSADTIVAATMDRADTNIILVGTHLGSGSSTVPFVEKIGLDGSHWYQQLDDVLQGASNASAAAVSVDKGNNIYVSGLVQSVGHNQIYVQKLDGQGDERWQTQFGWGATTLGEHLTSTLDGNGNLYLAGTYSGTANFGQMLTSSSSAADIFIVKLDYAGTLQWARSVGGDGVDSVSTLTVDGSGQIYLTGKVNGVADLDPGTGVLQQSGEVGDNAFLLKLNSAGLVNHLPQGGVSFSGSAQVGQTLQASNTILDADGFNSATLTYQWQFLDNNGWNDINGVTSDSFVLTQAELGRVLRVVANYVDNHGVSEQVASVASSSVSPAPAPDQVGDNAATAAFLSIGSTQGSSTFVVGTLETGMDKDFFAVNLLAGHSYNFQMQGQSTANGSLSDPFLKLYDTDGTTLLNYNDESVGHDAGLTFTATASGTYYLDAESAGVSDTGTYRLTATVTNVPAPTNQPPSLTFFDALPNDVTSATATALSFNDLLNYSNASDSDGTITALVVKSVSSGTLMIGSSLGTATAWVAGDNDLIDATHQAFWTSDVSANGNVNAFSLVARDDQGAESSTPVALTLHVVQPLSDLVGDTTGTAGSLTMDSYVDSAIDPSSDIDVFAVTLQAGNRYRFELQGVDHSAGTLGNPVLSLLMNDSFGNPTVLASNDDFGSLDSRIDYVAGGNGTYYLFADSLADTTGTYRLSAQLLNHAPTVTSVATSTDTIANAAAVTLAPALVLADADNDLISSATVQLSGGLQSSDLLSVGVSLPGGISASYNDITGTLVLTGSASVADYQAALRTVAFEGTTAGSYTVTWTVNDVSGLSNAIVESDLHVTAANTNAPTLTNVTPFTTSYAAGLNIPVYLANLLANGDEASSNSTVNAFVVKSVTSGTLMIGLSPYWATPWAQGTNDVIDFTHRAYWSSAANADGYTDAFTVVARDASGVESTTPVSVQLHPVQYSDVGESVYSAGVLTVPTVTGETGTISGSLSSEMDSDWFVVTLKAGMTYTFSMQGDMSNSNPVPDTWLRLIQPYTNPGPMGSFMTMRENDDIDAQNSNYGSQITYTAQYDTILYLNAASSTDTFKSGGPTLAGGDYVLTVHVDAQLSAQPVVQLTTAQLSYAEGDNAIVVNDALVLSDADSTQLSGANVTVVGSTEYNSTRDALGLAGLSGTWDGDHQVQTFSDVSGTGITATWNSVNGYLSLSGNASLADYQSVLRSVTYSSGDGTITDDRMLYLSVRDDTTSNSMPFGINSPTVVMAVLHTTGTNDAPTLADSGTSAYYGSSNGTPVALAPSLTVVDPDSTMLSGATVHIAGNFQAGTALAPVDVLAVTNLPSAITAVYDYETGTLTLTGSASVADYQTALRAVVFSSSVVGSRQIDWTISDGSLNSSVLTTSVDTVNTVALNSLNGSNGFLLHDLPQGSTQTYSNTVVSAAGDFDGDGFADFIIGTPLGFDVYGGSYLLFGSADGVGASALSLNAMGSHGLEIYSNSSYSADFGFSVASAGDLNGDGMADVIVTAPNKAVDGFVHTGTAYVIFGSSTATSLIPVDDVNIGNLLNGTNGFRIEGIADNMKLGSAVQTAGDVNGDGFADLLIGAPGFSNGDGAVYVVFGHSGAFNSQIDLSIPDGMELFRIDGIGGEQAGLVLDSAGDVNGDGFADFVMGALYGSSYVVFGKADGFASSLNVTALNGNDGFRLDNPPTNAAGCDVSSAGDFNGDGYGDLLLAALSYDSNTPDAAYVVFGHSGTFSTLDLTNMTPNEGFRLTIGNDTDDFSFSVSAIGDFNGDGYGDLLISAPSADPHARNNAGSVYVVFGHANSNATDITLTAMDASVGFRLDGVIAADRAGESVSAAGDVNGDGYADLIIGTYSSGNSYVLYGHANTEATVTVGDSYSPTSNAELFIGGLNNGWTEQHIETGGGADVVHAGAGDDFIKVSDLTFRLIDGGLGTDTLALDLPASPSQVVDLADWRGSIQSIEKIHLWNGATTLVVSATDLCNLSSESNTLTVDGNYGRLVLEGVWQNSGTFTGNYGINYDVYTSGAAVLRVLNDQSGSVPVYRALQQVDFSSVFNADLVAQYGKDDGVGTVAQIDTTHFVDGASALFITQNNANYYAAQPGDLIGLSDNGYYAPNVDHPVVHIKADDTGSGFNAFQLTHADLVDLNNDPITVSHNFDVTNGIYNSLHLFATGGNLDGVNNTATFHVVLNYADGSSESKAVVSMLDWYATPTTSDSYVLMGGMNRFETASVNPGVSLTGSISASGGAEIFGFKFAVDSSKVLNTFDLITDSVEGSAVVNYFGATLDYHSDKAPLDAIAPELISYTATMNGSDITLCSNIELNFSEDIAAFSGASLILHDITGENESVISLTDPQITIQGHRLIINPTDNLVANHNYSISISGDALSDLQGNHFAGLAMNAVSIHSEATLSDPLVLDLTGNGIHLTAINENTRFDMTGDGVTEKSGWFDQGNGVLVVDGNHNGLIDGIQELVSEQFANNAPSSLAALATLDSNQDGRIDSRDAAFAQLQVWIDVNQDGISQSGELETLQEVGIAALGLTLDRSAARTDHGNQITGLADIEFSDGHVGKMAEVQFSFVDDVSESAAQQVTRTIDTQPAANWESDALAELVSRAMAARDGVGASHVVFGHASNFDTPLDIPSLDGKTGFRLYAADAIVASAVDQFGDAYGDLLIDNSAADSQLFGHDNGFASMLDAQGLEALNRFRLDGSAAQQLNTSMPDHLADGAADWLAGNLSGEVSSMPNAALVLSNLATLDEQHNGLQAGNNLLLVNEQAVVQGGLRDGQTDAVSSHHPLDVVADTEMDNNSSHDSGLLSQEGVALHQDGHAQYLLDTGIALDLTNLLANQAQQGEQINRFDMRNGASDSVDISDLLDFSGSEQPFLMQGDVGDTLKLQNAMDTMLASNGNVMVDGAAHAVDSQGDSSIGGDTYMVHQTVDGLHTLLVGTEIVFNFTR